MIHILVVEDDEKLNRIVCTYLNDSGFQAKGCLNAQDAYDEMYNQLYDLIISDIMMRGSTGSSLPGLCEGEPEDPDPLYVREGRSSVQADGISARDRRLYGEADRAG